MFNENSREEKLSDLYKELEDLKTEFDKFSIITRSEKRKFLETAFSFFEDEKVESYKIIKDSYKDILVEKLSPIQKKLLGTSRIKTVPVAYCLFNIYNEKHKYKNPNGSALLKFSESELIESDLKHVRLILTRVNLSLIDSFAKELDSFILSRFDDGCLSRFFDEGVLSPCIINTVLRNRISYNGVRNSLISKASEGSSSKAGNDRIKTSISTNANKKFRRRGNARRNPTGKQAASSRTGTSSRFCVKSTTKISAIKSKKACNNSSHGNSRTKTPLRKPSSTPRASAYSRDCVNTSFLTLIDTHENNVVRALDFSNDSKSLYVSDFSKSPDKIKRTRNSLGAFKNSAVSFKERLNSLDLKSIPLQESSQLEALKKQVDALIRELDGKITELEECEEDVRTLLKRKDALDLISKDFLQDELKFLKAKLEEFQKKAEEAQRELAKANKQLEDQLAELKAKETELEQAKQQADAKVLDLEAQVAKAEESQEKLEASQNEAQKKLAEAKQQAEEAKGQLEAKLAEAKQQAKESQKKVSELEAQVAELAEAKGQAEEAKGQLAAQLAKAKQQAEESKERLEAQLALFQKQVSELEAQAEEFQEKLASQEKELAKAAASQEQVSELEAKLAESQEKVSELEAQVAELAEAKQQAEEANQQLEAKETELEQANQQLEAKVAALEGAIKELDNENKELKSINNCNQDLKSIIDTNSTELDKVLELEAQLEQSTQENEQLEAKLAEANQQLEAKVAAFEGAINELESKNKKLKSNNQELQSVNDNKVGELDKLLGLEAQLEEANQQLVAQAEASQKKVSDLESKAEELEASQKKLAAAKQQAEQAKKKSLETAKVKAAKYQRKVENIDKSSIIVTLIILIVIARFEMLTPIVALIVGLVLSIFNLSYKNDLNEKLSTDVGGDLSSIELDSALSIANSCSHEKSIVVKNLDSTF